MAKKEIKALVKIQLPAGKANPAPPVGTALGPHGIDIQAFCQQFNAQTQQMGDTVVPAEITIYEDRSFQFILKTPPAATLILKALNIQKGSGEPNKKKVGKLRRAQVKEIAEIKMPDLNAHSEEQAMKIIAGTARSMGVEVEE